jgi:hypothetical protein
MLPEGGWLTYEPQTAGVEEEEDEADEDEDGDEGGSEEEEDGEDDDQESDFEEDSESAEAAAGVPDPDTPRAFKRRKIKGNSGDCNPSDVGKIVFDDCETADPRYRQPRMVIVADISKTATYKVCSPSAHPWLPDSSAPIQHLNHNLASQRPAFP